MKFQAWFVSLFIFASPGLMANVLVCKKDLHALVGKKIMLPEALVPRSAASARIQMSDLSHIDPAQAAQPIRIEAYYPQVHLVEGVNIWGSVYRFNFRGKPKPSREVIIDVSDEREIARDPIITDIEIRLIDSPSFSRSPEELVDWMARQQLAQNFHFRNPDNSVEAKRRILKRQRMANRALMPYANGNTDLTTELYVMMNGIVATTPSGISTVGQSYMNVSGNHPLAEPDLNVGVLRGRTTLVLDSKGNPHEIDASKVHVSYRYNALNRAAFTNMPEWPYPTEPEQVETHLDELIIRANAIGPSSPLSEILDIFYELRFVHPMLDGNSKSSYVLLDAMLRRAGFPPLPDHEPTTRSIMFNSRNQVERNLREAYHEFRRLHQSERLP